jgi:hypothetical protein
MATDFQDTFTLFNRYAVGQELTREELNWLIFGLHREIDNLRKHPVGVSMNNVNTASGPIEISGVTVTGR